MAKTKKRRLRAEKAAPENAFSDVLFAWYAPEYIRFERGFYWYLFAGAFVLMMIAYAFWTGAWSMALVFIVLSGVYLLEHRRHPNLITVKISHWGVKFGDLELPFTEIKRFWIHHHPPHVDELRIETTSRIHPEVIIPLMGANPTLIRQYFATQVPEWEGKHLPLIDVLTRMLRLH